MFTTLCVCVCISFCFSAFSEQKDKFLYETTFTSKHSHVSPLNINAYARPLKNLHGIVHLHWYTQCG